MPQTGIKTDFLESRSSGRAIKEGLARHSHVVALFIDGK
jgi:hypothetical protein